MLTPKEVTMMVSFLSSYVWLFSKTKGRGEYYIGSILANDITLTMFSMHYIV